MKTNALVILYIGAIVCANLLVSTFGPAITPVNAFFLIGLDLALRDYFHDKWEGNNLFARMFGLLLIAGAVSYALNPATGIIAIASMVAFMVSGAIDALVYWRMQDQEFIRRSNASNAAGALADSIIFPTIAFGGLMPEIVAMQFGAKLLGGFAWSLLINKYQAR